jgi:SAM-dependent methyltransferase
MQIHRSAAGLFRALKTYLKSGDNAAPIEPDAEQGVPYRRFLSNNPMVYERAIAGAEAYVSRLGPPALDWLYAKPYDPADSGSQYFRLMYDLLNILQAMKLPPRARILEVGSGPGWVTEILLMLGHEVDALEPSADMIAVARDRAAGLEPHFRCKAQDRVRFHQNSIEEIEFPADSFDAVLYFDVLHHLIDERVAVEKTFRFLKPGGCVGVVEAAWHPDFKQLEASLIKEMEEYGTLENPFSTEYLDLLLRKAGFVEIIRSAGVNGLFRAEQLTQPLGDFGPPLHGVNNVVALKPIGEDPSVPSCANLNARTDLRYKLLAGGLDGATRKADLTVAITNSGETLLDNRAAARARVTFALRRGAAGSAAFMEATERHLLAAVLKPGESVTMTMQFTLPDEAPVDGWQLDAVAEGLYWFSSRGIGGLSIQATA